MPNCIAEVREFNSMFLDPGSSRRSRIASNAESGGSATDSFSWLLFFFYRSGCFGHCFRVCRLLFFFCFVFVSGQPAAFPLGWTYCFFLPPAVVPGIVSTVSRGLALLFFYCFFYCFRHCFHPRPAEKVDIFLLFHYCLFFCWVAAFSCF